MKFESKEISEALYAKDIIVSQIDSVEALIENYVSNDGPTDNRAIVLNSIARLVENVAATQFLSGYMKGVKLNVS